MYNYRLSLISPVNVRTTFQSEQLQGYLIGLRQMAWLDSGFTSHVHQPRKLEIDVTPLQVITKAAELGIFDLLYQENGPASVENLAKKNNFKSDILHRLLNCLAALKLVTKKHGNGKGIYLYVYNKPNKLMQI